MRTSVWLVLGLVLLAGCGRLHEPANSSAYSKKADALFVELFKDHGEKNVVTTSEGVGLGANTTRIGTSVYSSHKEKGSANIELEFRIKLSSGKEIVDYVAGMGTTEDKAFDDAFANFVLTTFHPVYRMFMNPAEPHQEVEKLTFADGKTRQIAMGDIMFRGSKDIPPDTFTAMRPRIKGMLSKLSLPEGAHWMKIVYAQSKSEPVTVAVTLDNNDNDDLTSAVQSLDWPHRDGFYMAKEFIVIE